MTQPEIVKKNPKYSLVKTETPLCVHAHPPQFNLLLMKNAERKRIPWHTVTHFQILNDIIIDSKPQNDNANNMVCVHSKDLFQPS